MSGLAAAVHEVLEAHLDDPRALVRAVLARLPGSGLILLDRDLLVRLAEGPALGERALGTEALQGRSLADVVPEPVWRTVEPRYRRAAAGHRQVFTMRSSDGRAHRVDAAPVRDGAGRVSGVLIVSQDTTDQEATARELRARLVQQSVVRGLGERALAATPLDQLMAETVVAVAETLRVDECAVLEPVPAAGETVLLVRAAVAWPPGTVLHGEPLAQPGVAAGLTVPVGGRETPGLLLAALHRTARPSTDEDATFLQAVANVIAGAVARAGTEERVHHAALHDPLTGLPNRTLLVDRLTLALDRAQRTGRPLAVLFCDLDGFKAVNDTFGHAAGDDLLRQIAARIRAGMRAVDTVSRLGGDEFVVLCEDLHDEAAADAMAARVAAAFAEPFALPGGTHAMTTSTGVLVARGGEGHAPADLLAAADRARYRAKDRGGARHERHGADADGEAGGSGI